MNHFLYIFFKSETREKAEQREKCPGFGFAFFALPALHNTIPNHRNFKPRAFKSTRKLSGLLTEASYKPYKPRKSQSAKFNRFAAMFKNNDEDLSSTPDLVNIYRKDIDASKPSSNILSSARTRRLQASFVISVVSILTGIALHLAEYGMRSDSQGKLYQLLWRHFLHLHVFSIFLHHLSGIFIS